MALDLQYDLVNLTPANASPVEANFNRIESYINTDLIARDGSSAMTAQLQLVGDPVNPLDAAPKQYVDAVLPIGIVMMYGGTTAPPGGKWALCNGASLATVTYPDLFSIMGYSFGGAGGSFSLPNFGGRTAVGPTTGYTHGATGGTADAVVVSHTHPIDHDHGSSTTGIESATHTHAGVDHLHGVNITTSTNGSHNHTFSPFAAFFNGTDANLDLFDGGTSQGYALTPFVNANGDHNHSVVGSTGAADRSLQTGGQSVNHTHAFDMPNFAGTSGAASAGVSGTNQNLPPYSVVTFIIRVL
jgi:microcystin-dependent protein